MSEETTPPIQFTDLARDTVLHFMEMEDDADLAVRIRVASPSPLDPRYEITLIEPDDVSEQDVSFDDFGFRVVLEPESAKLLEGASIDWIETLNESGFKVHNPNITPIGSLPLEGPLAERVQQVIDQYVNPGVAQHGGAVTLVEVREETAFVRMTGGCQGCGLASVTLSQGVERIITQQVPEITSVQDVTNHAAGQNPYFASSK
jgi:Fe/S biogenesis protein NfuA